MEAEIDAHYVMDIMQPYEIKPLMEKLPEKRRDAWEMTRFLAFITAQVNSTKKLKMEDILKFTWDENTEKSSTSISNTDIERLRTKADEYLNKH